MSEPREKICANFLVQDDPYHDYVNWRHFLRQWFVLGPFSFVGQPYATAGREQEALDEDELWEPVRRKSKGGRDRYLVGSRVTIAEGER